MNSRIAVVPGQWYRNPASGNIFQVVSLDEQDGSLEMQYTDGALDEMSVDEWMATRAEPCDQPEDWVGPFDDLESDDIGMPEATAAWRGAEVPIERALLEIEELRAAPIGNADD